MVFLIDLERRQLDDRAVVDVLGVHRDFRPDSDVAPRPWQLRRVLRLPGFVAVLRAASEAAAPAVMIGEAST